MPVVFWGSSVQLQNSKKKKKLRSEHLLAEAENGNPDSSLPKNDDCLRALNYLSCQLNVALYSLCIALRCFALLCVALCCFVLLCVIGGGLIPETFGGMRSVEFSR